LSENKRMYLWAIFEIFHSTMTQLDEELSRFPSNEETKLVLTNLKTVSSIGIKRLRSLYEISFNQTDPIQQKEVLEEVAEKILQRVLPEQCCLSDDMKEMLGKPLNEEI
jgi:hypothetical protein